MVSYKSLLNFNNKNVVIVGGCGLIGKRITEAFLEFDANVIVCDVNETEFHKNFSQYLKDGKIHFRYFDLSDRNNIESTINSLVNSNEKIDVWINVAYPRTSDWGNHIQDVIFESWNENIKNHLGGYFWSSKIILEHMKKNKGGCLINFSSIYGVLGPNFSIYESTDMTCPVAYSAIKGAIISLDKYYATYYGPFNVRINSICPGGVFNEQKLSFVTRYNKLTPLGRMAKDYEIAMPVLFLASDAASYITGQTLMVDGGWSAW